MNHNDQNDISIIRNPVALVIERVLRHLLLQKIKKKFSIDLHNLMHLK